MGNELGNDKRKDTCHILGFKRRSSRNMNPQRIRNYLGTLPQLVANLLVSSIRNLSATVCTKIRNVCLGCNTNMLAGKIYGR
jgi:hypothetical protein